MLASVFTEAKLDPTIVIGGKVNALGGNAKLGKGEYVIAEADESDGSFLHLPATYAIVTNIDNDHLDHYGDLAAIDAAFIDFVAKIPFYGVAAVCAEDAGVKRCLAQFSKPVVTYGFSQECDYSASEVTETAHGSRFKVLHQGALLGDIQIQVPGRHNVLNAMSVVAVSHRIGLPFERIKEGLARFEGVRRRFEVCWKNASGSQMIVDDYGHHPTEVVATLSAARSCWKGRIIGVFQPHRYTRTLHCKEGFLSALGGADVLLMTDVYAAGEEPIAGVDSASLAAEIRARHPGKQIDYVGTLDQAEKKVLSLMRDGDLVLCMGAGSITQLPAKLVSRLQS
jgi:UDP-N-acetylmuramate--alanine ligase